MKQLLEFPVRKRTMTTGVPVFETVAGCRVLAANFVSVTQNAASIYFF